MSYIQGPIGAGGGGTVTSVGLSLPSIFTVSGSPVVGAGTLTAAFNTEPANTVFSGPASGADAPPTFRALVAADVPSSILPGGFTGFANPTAVVGLTAVNGSATTAMRSDAAPPLDQTAAYAFSGLGATNLLSASVLSWNSDAFFVRDGANAIAQRNGANAQAFLVYKTFTDASNYERWSLNATSNPELRFVAAGTGQARNISLINQTNGAIFLATNNTNRITIANDGTFTLTQTGGWIATNPAAATLQLGAANAASPVAQTLQAQGSRAGTDANTAGANYTDHAGIGTGNIGTASRILQGIIGNATTTTTAQTVAAAITIPGVASGQLPGAVIGSAAIATNATDGFLYLASGAGTPTGTPTAFTGRVPLYVDTTNSQLWMFLGGAWKQPKTPAGAALVTWQ